MTPTVIEYPVPDASTGPLAGWRVLVPRPEERAGELIDALRAADAQPVAVALISIAPPADPTSLDHRLLDLADGVFAWIGFTSFNAVDAVLERASALGLARVIPVGTRIAAVGPATATALRSAGLPVDLIPATGSSDALAADWPRASSGQTVLLPRSDLAAPGLPRRLTAKGYRVEEVTAYRTVVQPAPVEVAADLTAGRFDAVLFTSPSTVTALADVEIARGTVIGAIGQRTAVAVGTSGRHVHFTADRPTARALVDGLINAARPTTAHTIPDTWKRE